MKFKLIHLEKTEVDVQIYLETFLCSYATANGFANDNAYDFHQQAIITDVWCFCAPINNFIIVVFFPFFIYTFNYSKQLYKTDVGFC